MRRALLPVVLLAACAHEPPRVLAPELTQLRDSLDQLCGELRTKIGADAVIVVGSEKQVLGSSGPKSVRVVEDGQKFVGRRVGERVVLVVYFRGEPTFIPANPNPKPHAALVAATQKIKTLVDEQLRDPARDKLLGRMDERAAAAILSQARVGAPKKR